MWRNLWRDLKAVLKEIYLIGWYFVGYFGLALYLAADQRGAYDFETSVTGECDDKHGA